jgi:lipase maturation factor 1
MAGGGADVASRVRALVEHLFGPGPKTPGRLWPRWLFLRALGLIFFSAFYSLAFQIHGLIGEHGILPAGSYLYEIGRASPGLARFWVAPTLLWANASDAALTAVIAAGIVGSVLLTLNVWPRLSVALCTLLFMSCVGALQDFSSYQSDGMLLEAGFISIFFAPRGIRPGLGATDPPSRASLFLLQFEWFRIYFESGVAKIKGGDPHWRNLTAMDNYYENGPLPTWVGWYVQQFPHAYHAATALLTLVIELVVVWAVFMPRRFRIACFLIVTPLQLGIIATANYAFLNYLVLVLGVLLLDDKTLARVGLRAPAPAPPPARSEAAPATAPPTPPDAQAEAQLEVWPEARTDTRTDRSTVTGAARYAPAWRTWTAALALGLVFYATLAAALPNALGPLKLPARVLGHLRIVNHYGLFGMMTEARYEIEFQGTRDGRTWLTYPFRYKPQDPREAPGIFAPYQPRFDWNLWFASLDGWRASPWVVLAQARLLENSPSVLALFAQNPFPDRPPTQVRTVLWQYWFTDRATRRATGQWWRRRELGPFSGVLTRGADGKLILAGSP